MPRFYVVGDIHGCLRELEVLLAGLPVARGDTLAFIGDYVDRGPESRAVIDLLLSIRGRDDVTTVFLRGNHEDMCLSYLGRRGQWGEAWRANGGITTLRSYGALPEASGERAAAHFPPEHLEFLESLRLSFVGERHLLVHAGIRPTRRLEDQEAEDLLWIREEFIMSPHQLPYTIVFGHTPHRQVLLDLPFKIGIDTGCVYGGRLTAIELEEGVVHQVGHGERQVRRTALPVSTSQART